MPYSQRLGAQMKDPFTTIVDAPWWRILGLGASVYLGVWLFFGALYWTFNSQNLSTCHKSELETFMDAFLLSLDSQVCLVHPYAACLLLFLIVFLTSIAPSLHLRISGILRCLTASARLASAALLSPSTTSASLCMFLLALHTFACTLSCLHSPSIRLDTCLLFWINQSRHIHPYVSYLSALVYSCHVSLSLQALVYGLFPCRLLSWFPVNPCLTS